MPTPPIPSPYSFVPLSRHVFFPDWAAQVSQDVPFSDGISGWFEIEVEATTPIYIRNGGDFDEGSPKDDQKERERKRRARLQNPDWQSFYRLFPNGPLAIPGTSLKGMLRSVLEIATFAKMRGVDARAYSVRDLHNRDLYNRHLTGGDEPSGYHPLARPGWLRQGKDGTWEVVPCQMARVEQADLEELAGDTASPGFLGRAQRAGGKYKKWWDHEMRLTVGFTADRNPQLQPNHSQPLRYRRVSQLWPSDEAPAHATKGSIVFTGQPQNREEQDGGTADWYRANGSKHMEFIFFDREKQPLLVPRDVQEDFLFIHCDQHGQPNEDLRFLLKEFRDEKQDIPVFFLAEGQAIKSIGLALMYRLPYRFRLPDLVREQQPDSANEACRDFAETLFGTFGDAGCARGRVAFESLPAVDGTARELSEVTTVLNAPKPSFYPNYLEQRIVDRNTGRIGGDYATLMDADEKTGCPTARLRGWKRYPARADHSSPEDRPVPTNREGKVNLDVVTRFRPLDQGVRFTGRVHVHNLRPAELGGLLWALTWGGETALRHRLGMGKPLGYGHVAIRLTDKLELLRQTPTQKRLEAHDLVTAQSDFVSTMESWTKRHGLGCWPETGQLKALKAMASPATQWPRPLSHPLKPKTFAGFKKDRLALLPVPGVGFDTSEVQPTEQPAAPTAPPAAPLAQSEPLPRLEGQIVEARVKFRNGPDAVFKFSVVGREFTGLPVPELRPAFRKSLPAGKAFPFRVAGPPDENGRYPLAAPE
jgi:CRISPR-associated protein (TIGR03986 family)